MANPQAENGHIDIAHEVAEAFFTLQLSGNQNRVLWVILRQTWGWKKKADRISISFFEKKTGLDRRHIYRALMELKERKIITIAKNGNRRTSSYGFQKDYSLWKPPIQSIAKNSNSLLPKLATKLLPKMAPTKEKKETFKKKRPITDSPKALETFLKEKAEEIYQTFPRKADRPNSIKSITRVLSAPPADLICPVGGLRLAVDRYRAKIKAEGTEPRYMIQSNNFFGKSERWKEFLEPTSEPSPKPSSSYPVTGSLLDRYPLGSVQ
jgi:phage replication O-like protein O